MAQPKEDTLNKEEFVDELKPGTKLMHGQYTIDSFLNAGGFGITYLARDSLDRKIVIKECFPGAFCRRSRYVVQARSRAHQNELKSIVRLFVQEARSLAKLDHPNIVGVHQVFEDNDTAYMALDFVEGRDLLDTIEDGNHGLSPSQIKTILKELLGAVGFIHDQDILHRDISPDNILISKDLHPVLIDFGAAREEATKQSRVLSALRVVKDGYSPQEFYIAGSQQGPSSDLYALAASFHHLIANDVPPNSQARLAAIASGDPDPYKPVAGRFPEYEDHFLKALDKALAVLPKDRVQSAKDWIKLIDGADGNVTPLPLNNASSAAAAPAAATAQKSKMPLLLGSAAAVGLLVGVGVMTMTGGDDAPVAQAPAPQEPVVVEAPAPTLQEPVVVEAPAPAPQEPVVVEAPAPAPQEPVVVEAPAPVPTPQEPVVAEAPVVVEVPAPVEAPIVVQEPVIVQEPVVVATPEPAPLTEEPSVVAALEEAISAAPVTENVATPAVPSTPTEQELGTKIEQELGTTAGAIAGPEVTDTPIPDVRPTARPATAAPVEVQVVAPLPEPVVTPDLASVGTIADPSFPEQILAFPTSDVGTPGFALPDAPIAVSSVGNGPVIDILAVTPGNEIIEEPLIVIADEVVSSWSVVMPFTAANDTSNIVDRPGPVTPVWVTSGLQIDSVNGVQIDAINDIPAILRAGTDEATLTPTVTVTFGTTDTATGTSIDRLWFLPVKQDIVLADGTAFEATFSGSGWRTVVAELGAGQVGGLELGDVITSYIPTSEVVDDRETLAGIFARERSNGVSQFTFAVERSGSLWVASLAYPGAN